MQLLTPSNVAPQQMRQLLRLAILWACPSVPRVAQPSEFLGSDPSHGPLNLPNAACNGWCKGALVLRVLLAATRPVGLPVLRLLLAAARPFRSTGRSVLRVLCLQRPGPSVPQQVPLSVPCSDPALPSLSPPSAACSGPARSAPLACCAARCGTGSRSGSCRPSSARCCCRPA